MHHLWAVMPLLRIIAISISFVHLHNVLCTSVWLFPKTTFALAMIYTSVRFEISLRDEATFVVTIFGESCLFIGGIKPDNRPSPCLRLWYRGCMRWRYTTSPIILISYLLDKNDCLAGCECDNGICKHPSGELCDTSSACDDIICSTGVKEKS